MSPDTTPTDGTALPADNWQATRVGLVLTTVLATATTAAFVHLTATWRPALATAAGMVLLLCSVRLFETDAGQPLAAVLASVTLVGGGLGLLAGLGLVARATLAGSLAGTVLVGRVVVLVGVGTVVAGVLAAWLDVVGDGVIGETLTRTRRVWAVPLVAFVLSALRQAGPVDAVVEAVAGIPDLLLSPPVTDPHLGTFLILVALATACLRAAVRALPLSTLVAADRRERVRAALIRVDRALTVLLWLAVPLAVGAVAVEQSGNRRRLYALFPSSFVASLASVTTATSLRTLLAAVAVGGGGVAGLLATVRRLLGTPLETVRALAPLAGGGLVAVLALVGHGTAPVQRRVADLPVYESLVGTVGASTVAFGAVVGVLVLVNVTLLGLAVLYVLGAMGRRTAGAVFAASGVFIVVLGAGLTDTSPLVVFAGVAASALVLDFGEYAATLGREVGRTAQTVQGELLHALGSLLVGVVGVCAAAVLFRLVGTLSFPTDALGLPMVLAAFLGLLALVIALVVR